MSDANQVALRYGLESTYGTAASGNYQNMRFTNESLIQSTNTTNSNEIRSDRQIADIIRTGFNAGGDINFELSSASYDDFFESALQADAAWPNTNYGDLTGNPALTFANGAATITRAAGDWSSDNFADEDWIYCEKTGATNTGKFFRINSSTATVLTVEPAPADESSSTGWTVTGSNYITNGVNSTGVADSYTIEREYSDLSSEFVQYTGMSIDTLAINVAIEQIVTGSFGFLGQKATHATSTTGGTAVAATSTTVMNAVDHVKGFVENSAEFSITQFNFTARNNLRARSQVGTEGAISIGSGSLGIEGSIQAYLTAAASAAVNRYLGNTATNVAIGFEDGAGAQNAYVMEFPQVKFSAGQRVAGGINQDVFADLNFSAYRGKWNSADSAEYTIRIHRFAAV